MNLKYRFPLCVVILLLIGLTQGLVGQADPILFTVEEDAVPVSEFNYIYQKNNRDEADYSSSSVREYLDLYIKFKLKVQRAKELQLDTIQSLQEELAGYRNQLAKTYLNDKEVKSRLVKELYDRMQWDLHIAHILIKENDLRRNDQRDEKAETTIWNIHKRLKSGESFEALAKEVSQDKNTNDNGGDLGYLTAKFPNGFYEMENAAYSLKPGEFSEPVKSALGYHILYLHDKRPARGEIEAAHILVRVHEDGTNSRQAEQKINTIYKSLEEGGKFEDLARSMSEDSESARKGGFIGSFGINTYEESFEDAVFSLEEDQAYTEPVRSSLGWHIIKRLKKQELPSFEEMERRLESIVTRDERITIARESMVETIIKESEMDVDSALLEDFAGLLDQSFFTYQWVAPDMDDAIVLSFKDGSEASLENLKRWLRINARERLRLDRQAGARQGFYTIFDGFVEDQCLAYEERNLEKKYPEFKALMREYEEGILLFEVTRIAVWDKASQDTAGLHAYYNLHKDNYMWPERLLHTEYTVDSLAAGQIDKILKWEQKMNPRDLAEKVNKKSQILTYSTRKVEPRDAEELPWQSGYRSPTSSDENGDIHFTKVEKILPPEHKSLSEARGYIIADYQDQLEKEWIAGLRKKYSVEVNEEVLESLIKT